jgi:hypothetical protein
VAEQSELTRSLALARQALHGPASMKARVRGKLAASGADQPGESEPAPPNASGARRGLRAIGREPAELARVGLARRLLSYRPHLGTVTVLLGVSFGVGFWFGGAPDAPLELGSAEQHSPGSSLPASNESDAALNGARHAAVTAPPEVPVPPHVDAVRAPGTSEANTSQAGTSGQRHSAPAAARGGSRAKRRAEAHAEASHGSVLRGSAWRAQAALGDAALAGEVALLERTERAIRKADAPLALALLAELDQKFPEAALPEERGAARVLASCAASAAGNSHERSVARALAQDFVARSPASVYATRIRRSCLLESNAPSDAPNEEHSPGGH